MAVRFAIGNVQCPTFANLINQMGVIMSVARLRNIRAFRNALLLAASAPLAMAAPAMAAETAAAATDGSVRFGTWGVDLSSRDPKTNPGDDFERYASGSWFDANDIPADKSGNGVRTELDARAQEQGRAVVMNAPADSQLGAIYQRFVDEGPL